MPFFHGTRDGTSGHSNAVCLFREVSRVIPSIFLRLGRANRLCR